MSKFTVHMLKHWAIRPTLKYIPVIIAIGIALGIADNALSDETRLVDLIVVHTITSLCIGLPLIVLVTNKQHIGPHYSENHRIILFGLAFAVIGMLASEIELIVRKIAFDEGQYQLLAGGGLYIFNAILSVILGFTMMNPMSASLSEKSLSQETDEHAKLDAIPVKKGTSIHLIPVDSICLLEAADKYAYVYDTAGDKHLCDSALSLLADRLPSSFTRIHRRFIVNITEISRIQPFDKKRFVIEFNTANLPTVRSSAGYQQVIKELIKI